MLSNLYSADANGDTEDLYWVPEENNANYTSDSFMNVKIKWILKDFILVSIVLIFYIWNDMFRNNLKSMFSGTGGLTSKISFNFLRNWMLWTQKS